jgi:hypothetical protein
MAGADFIGPHEPAVWEGVPRYTSISAINRFLACERSWYFRYVKGLPDPAGPAAEFGIGAHKRFEWFYERKDPAILGPVERAGVHLMPPAGAEGHAFEHPVNGVLFLGSLRMVGGMDSKWLGERRITDLKFKGRSSYGRAGMDDWRQLIAYAESVRREHNLPGDEVWELRHVHFLREGTPKADGWYARVPLDRVKSEWHSLADSVEPRLREVARAERAKDVPANTGHCLKYGKPCAYMKQCPLSMGERLMIQRPDWVKGEDMGLLSNKIQATPGATPPAAAAPAAPMKAPPILEVGQTYKLADGRTGSLVAVEGPIVTLSIEGVRQDVSAAKIIELVRPIQSAAPVPAPSVPAVSAEEAQAAVAEDAAKEAAAKPKAGPGRPKKAPKRTEAELLDLREQNAQEWPDTTKVEPVAPPETITMPPAPANTAPLPPAVAHTIVLEPTPAAEGLRLFFGCVPVGVPVKSLQSYVRALQAEILSQAEDDSGDVRLSDHKMLGFGKWKATLAQAALERPPEPGLYVVGDEELERLVGEVLVPKCAGVVRGVR